MLIAVWLLAGCGGSRALNMTLAGKPDMNSIDDGGGGNAAVVRIYQLSNETNFRDVTLEAFWQNDEEALGSELIAPPQQIRLFPDQQETIKVEPTSNTKFIGVAADLRQPDRERWRQIYSIEEMKGKRIMVEVGKNYVTIDLR